MAVRPCHADESDHLIVMAVIRHCFAKIQPHPVTFPATNDPIEIANFYHNLQDITPTGSLRRRRSRGLSAEDDGILMDFLRSSGHDNGSRERKPSSYGSLGEELVSYFSFVSFFKRQQYFENILFYIIIFNALPSYYVTCVT